MWISDISIRRPVFATMVIMSFMVLGIVSLTRLGIDLFPDVNFPFVNVSVVYPGASPEEVETLVTRPIEDAVAGINGVKRVVSSSTESFSRVGLELRLEVDPQAAAAGARVLYTDVWASMGQEAEAEARRQVFRPFQVNSALLERAHASAVVMHCLPAHRGEEISAEVIDGPRSVVFQQAENRLHAQKGLLAALLA